MTSGIVAVSLDDSDDGLRSLAAWLRDEDEFRGRVRLEEQPPRHGQMGGALDAVVVVLSSGTASAFVSSIFAWLARNREVRKVSLKVRSESGREVDLTCGSADDAALLIENIRRLLSVDG